MAVYLQEIVAIDGGGKEEYLRSVVEDWAPYAEESRGMRLVWAGSTIGMTGRWPEAIVLWELRDWQHWASVCDRMYTDGVADVRLRDWWRTAARLRLRSRSRTLVGAPFSPTLDQLRARGVTGVVFAFSMFRVPAVKTETFLALLEDRIPVEREKGRDLVGAYQVAFTPRSAYAVWAHRDPAAVADYESSRRDGDWRLVGGDLVERWTEEWGFAIPGSPLWPASEAPGPRIW